MAKKKLSGKPSSNPTSSTPPEPSSASTAKSEPVSASTAKSELPSASTGTPESASASAVTSSPPENASATTSTTVASSVPAEGGATPTAASTPTEEAVTPTAGPAPVVSATDPPLDPTATTARSAKVPLLADRSPAGLALIDGVLALGLLVLAFLLASFAVRNSDFWQHLAAGRFIVHQGWAAFGQDPFSYTGTGRTWVNHAWLYDVVVYLLVENLGPKLAVVLKALVVTVIVGLLLTTRRAGENRWPWIVLIGLALIASAPRLLLQPMLASMLCLSALLVLLMRVPARAGSWRLPIGVAGVSWLWACCDQWFFLAPILVAGFALGERLQAKVQPDYEPTRGSDGKVWAYTLGLSLLACCLTPNHLRVWQLPTELVDSEVIRVLRTDPEFRPLFATPLEQSADSGNRFTNPLNNLAFFILLGVSILTLAFSYQQLRWSYAIIWMIGTLIALVHARAVPFCVLVTAPITAHYLGAYGDSFRQQTLGAGTVRLLNLGSVTGRIVTLGLLIVALIAVWPGWLHPFYRQPLAARRVAWEIEPSATHERTAMQLQAWTTAKLLPSEARGLMLSPSLANYLGWYAPDVRNYFDTRLSFHAPEAKTFIEMAKGIRSLGSKDTKPSDVREVEKLLDEQQISYVVIDRAQQKPDDFLPLLAYFWNHPNDWPMWYMDGQSLIFGRAKAHALPNWGETCQRLRLEPSRLAFGAKATASPNIETWPPELGPKRDFYLSYLTPPPAPPLEATEAELWMKYFAFHRERFLRTQTEYLSRTSRWIAAQAALPRLAPSFLPPPRGLFGGDEDLTAALTLAIRAGRRGVRASPQSSDSFYWLAMAYQNATPAPQSPEEFRFSWLPHWRLLHSLANLQRAMSRLQNLYGDELIVRRQWLELAFNLTGLYLTRTFQQYDLALEAFRQTIALAERLEPEELPLDQREAILQSAQTVMWALFPEAPMQGVFGPPNAQMLRDVYVATFNEFAKGKRSPQGEVMGEPERIVKALSDRYFNQSTPNEVFKANLAAVNGLPGEGANVLRRLDWATLPDPNLQFSGLLFLIHLNLYAGRTEEAAQLLQQLETEAANLLKQLANDPTNPVYSQYLRVKLMVELTGGNYDAAAQTLQQMGGPWLPPERDFPSSIKISIREQILANLSVWLEPDPLRRNLVDIVTQTVLTEQFLQRARAMTEIDYRTQQGLLALEAGDNARAEALFRQALKPGGNEIAYPNQSLARAYLRAFDKAKK